LASAPVRILIVDDNEHWRQFLYSFLQHDPAWQIICAAPDGLEAVEKSLELQPDVILLDIGLPELNGIEAARQIRKLAPSSRILFLTENSQPGTVREALRAGGYGYVLKSDAGRELTMALEVVIANGRFVGRKFVALES
jgi:DNA-binding NarL/FixJ family response regulator